MMSEFQNKVTADHLKRSAYLYIRQSTLRQVLENTESTKRQYGLRQKAVVLGWPENRVIVIDSDLGKSGAEIDRSGFQELVAEVGLGRAGIVMGLEVSRLARNSMDWHRLLEICALTETLILDEDGIYDPSHFNDRLLLGLKGTMSEAELHVLRVRLHGGIINKARRGELRLRLPVGLSYDSEDTVILDPDQQVQQAMRTLFETFSRTGSAFATFKYFRDQDFKFPRRPNTGPHKGDVVWKDLGYDQTLQVLHNPRYAGAFVFGKSRTRNGIHGNKVQRQVNRNDWKIVLHDNHPGYISWKRFEVNQQRLKENKSVLGLGADKQKCSAREGSALLQGMAICGKCGSRMTVRYSMPGGKIHPNYKCEKLLAHYGGPSCQYVTGINVDAAVGQLLLETMTSLNLDVALAVEAELQSRIQEADKLRKQQVDRARYEMELAQRRYLRVDPDNRLVADSLEAAWNNKLCALQVAQEEYERQCQRDRRVLDEQKKREIRSLANDFPQIWNNPKTPNRERKRLIRLLIDDVTLVKTKQIEIHVRFKGGATKTLFVPLSKNACMLAKTDPVVIEKIDRFLDKYTDKQIAEKLNAQGVRSGKGNPFHSISVYHLRRQYSLKSRYERLREAGMLSKHEMAQRLGISDDSVNAWRRKGILHGYAYNDRMEYLYEPPGENPPVKHQRKT